MPQLSLDSLESELQVVLPPTLTPGQGDLLCFVVLLLKPMALAHEATHWRCP